MQNVVFLPAAPLDDLHVAEDYARVPQSVLRFSQPRLPVGGVLGLTKDPKRSLYIPQVTSIAVSQILGRGWGVILSFFHRDLQPTFFLIPASR